MTDDIAPAPVVDNAPAPAPSPAPVADWKSALPEDIRADPTLSKFTTQEGLAKSYINLEKMLGADKVVIPKEGDTEGWDRFYKAAGHPETPDAYGFKAPEQVPDGMQYNPDLDKRIAGIFHGAKLDPRQAAAVRAGLLEIVGQGATESLDATKQAEAQRLQSIQQGESALKAEWGQAFEQRGKAAGAAINKFLSPETIAAMDAAGLANNPALIKDMYALGVKMVGEKDLIGEADLASSPADLDAKIAKFNADNMAALMDQTHPGHVVAVNERKALYEKRWGNALANQSIQAA